MAILSPIIPHSMDLASIMYILDTQIHLSPNSPLFSYTPNGNFSNNSHSHNVLFYLDTLYISFSRSKHILLICYYYSIIIVIYLHYLEFINSLFFMPPSTYDVKINFLSNFLNLCLDEYLNQIIN